MNRRNWLRNAGLIGAGLATAPAIMAKPSQAPTWYEGVRSWERSLAFTPRMQGLNARLLANENPYGPSPMARLAIMEAVNEGNRYGHADAARLIDMLAEKEGVSKEQIMLGPGSTDILEKTAIVLFRNGGNVVSADPAYMSLIKTAQSFGATWKSVPCKSDWSHDLEGMKAAIDADTKLVYICNPNNPTGAITDGKALYQFCDEVADRVPIFVDEAYLEFLPLEDQQSMVELVQKGKNLIVARTFSKIHGMAGLRLGYGIAQPALLEKISSMARTTMGLNITTLRGGMASLQDEAFLKQCRAWNKEVREYTTEKLVEMGYTPIPSHTSFILFPLEQPTDGQVFLQKMLEQGIGVRYFDIHNQSYCRVSIGTMEENSLFLEGLKKVIG